jgi:hypothetical protein
LVEDHPLIQGRLFLALPAPLLEAVVRRVGEKRFDPDVLALDRRVAQMCGDLSWRIGLLNGQPFCYSGLFDPTPMDSAVRAFISANDDLGPEWANVNIGLLTEAEKAANWQRAMQRGYCGWLVINPLFIREQEQFLSRWQDEASQNLASTGLMVGRLAQKPADEFREAGATFLDRWLLTSLKAPFLPEVLGAQLPTLLPQMTTQLSDLGTCFFWPHNMPLPDRDTLRKLIEDALRHRSLPEHLKDWGEIIAADTTPKKQIVHFGRLFRLRHFWSVLFSRHAAALEGHMTAIQEDFANFLCPKSSSSPAAKAEITRKDLLRLSRAHANPKWFLPQVVA